MARSPNILIINHYAGSKTHGMEFRPYYLAREWRKLGCKVTIVAASFSHLRRRSPEMAGTLQEELVDGVPYIWLRTPKYKGNGIGRLLNMGSFIRELYRHASVLIAKCRPNIVITTSTYPLANLPAYYLARSSHARYVYEVRDLWPLTLTELNGMPRWHPLILLMQWAENFSYRNADCVSSTLVNAEAHMRRHGLKPDRFAYVPHGVALEEWQAAALPLSPNHMRCLSDLKAGGRFIICYAGSHGISNALDHFLDAAQLLSKQPIAFILVGNGPEKPRLEARAKTEQLDNVWFLPTVPKEAIPALLQTVDACFLGWQKKRLYEFGVSPNKLLDYMMSGRPVVHSTPAGNNLVSDSQCGLSVPAEDASAIAEAIQCLARMPAASRDLMGLRGKRYVQRHHSYDKLAQHYLEVLKSTVSGNNGVDEVRCA